MQFLVIARVAEGTPMEKVMPLVQTEAAHVWEDYKADFVRSIHYIGDMSGAVLMVEADSLEAAKKAVAKLPMVEAGVLNPEIIPLKPYTGLEALFAK
jgi:hypothetical protein